MYIIIMQTIERLNRLNLAVAPRTLHRTLEDLGSMFDNKVKQWVTEGEL